MSVFATHAHGKLLLTGEYFVLDGALALALPVRYGQSLRVDASDIPYLLQWTSRDERGEVWFQADIGLPDLQLLGSSDAGIATTLLKILHACRQQEPAFLGTIPGGLQVTTQNDFPRDWGLGTSSTLIAAVAKWAKVNPYQLLFNTMGGSGYDVACAYATGPLLYRLSAQKPDIQVINLEPDFSNHLYFVFLGKKQDSRAGIQRYRERVSDKFETIEKISVLTTQCATAPTLPIFEQLLAEHEAIIGAALDITPVQAAYFQDYWGVVKSLGAWGGDFVLATSMRDTAETRAYFTEKGYSTVVPWGEMILGGVKVY